MKPHLISTLSPVFPLSRLRERVPDRAGEGVGSNIVPSLKFFAVIAKGHPHPAFGHLLPQAGEGEVMKTASTQPTWSVRHAG